LRKPRITKYSAQVGCDVMYSDRHVPTFRSRLLIHVHYVTFKRLYSAYWRLWKLRFSRQLQSSKTFWESCVSPRPLKDFFVQHAVIYPGVIPSLPINNIFLFLKTRNRLFASARQHVFAKIKDTCHHRKNHEGRISFPSFI